MARIGLLESTTNPIESCLSTVQRVARNVKRWLAITVASSILSAGRHILRMQKALTQMNLQLANVLSDVSGMTEAGTGWL